MCPRCPPRAAFRPPPSQALCTRVSSRRLCRPALCLPTPPARAHTFLSPPPRRSASPSSASGAPPVALEDAAHVATASVRASLAGDPGAGSLSLVSARRGKTSVSVVFVLGCQAQGTELVPQRRQDPEWVRTCRDVPVVQPPSGQSVSAFCKRVLLVSSSGPQCLMFKR